MSEHPSVAIPDLVTDPDTDADTDTDEGDHDRFAHYVRKDKLQESQVAGTPVRALCGKVWVPGRDPSKYPVCPTCKEIASRWNQRGAN